MGRWASKHKGKMGRYLLLGGIGLYLYSALVNSIRLGIERTFGPGPVERVFEWSPFKNLAALFTPTGFGITFFSAVMYLLFTRKGFNWLTGIQINRDPRGFDTLSDGTHGTSGWMARKEFGKVFEIGDAASVKGTLLGKHKAQASESDQYADYLAVRDDVGLNPHTLIIGTSGTGKSRGFIRPFAMKCIERGESVILVDPKAELYESLAGHFEDSGYTVKALNLLDMDYSDAWNVIADIETDKSLVPAVADIIIKNTSNADERQDFWEKAEQNLLMALLHYVTLLNEENTNRRLPIHERSLGTIYELLSAENFENLDRRMHILPDNHPAKAPYGVFRLANRQIWGNIAIGLGNRLSVFQNESVDRITRFNEIDLELPGKKPCAYFCIISDQDSSMEFMSSMFFSMLFARLTNYARRHGDQGRLPVPVNVCLDEFCNVGKLVDFKRTLGVARSRRISCQLAIQSLSGLADRYPRMEWEELIALCDIWQFLGCNDLKTAEYISKKCGDMTIQLQNRMKPLSPLFPPLAMPTRPYSETKSNYSRPLMMPDEVLRLPNEESIILLRGQKPIKLYKLTPEEMPQFHKLRRTLISDHNPLWRQGDVSKRKVPPAPPGPPSEQEDTPASSQRQPPRPRTGVTLQQATKRNQPKPPMSGQYRMALPDDTPLAGTITEVTPDQIINSAKDDFHESGHDAHAP